MHRASEGSYIAYLRKQIYNYVYHKDMSFIDYCLTKVPMVGLLSPQCLALDVSSNDPKLSAKILAADLKLLTDLLRAISSLNISKTDYMIFLQHTARTA